MSYYPESAGMSGMTAFLSSIPMNLYAILTIFMIFYISLKKERRLGPMLKAELLAERASTKEELHEQAGRRIS